MVERDLVHCSQGLGRYCLRWPSQVMLPVEGYSSDQDGVRTPLVILLSPTYMCAMAIVPSLAIQRHRESVVGKKIKKFGQMIEL